MRFPMKLILAAVLPVLAIAAPAGDTELAQHAGCDPSEYSQTLIFFSGEYQFRMYVPVDGTIYNTTIDGPDTNSLYCVTPWGTCSDCFLYMNAIQVLNKGYCAVTVEDLKDGEWVVYDIAQESGSVSVIPGPPWQVVCNHPLKAAEGTEAEEVKDAAVEQNYAEHMTLEKRHEENEEDSDAYQRGCKQSEYSQRVNFYSQNYKFSMYVPVDDKTYKTGLSDDEDTLICATTWGTCQDCFLEMDHVEVVHPGSCKILMKGFETKEWTTYNVDQSSGKIAFRPSVPWEITCNHPLKDDKITSGSTTAVTTRAEAISSYCPNWDDGEFITLTTPQNEQYILPVPANGTTFHIGDDYDRRDHIGCVGPLGSKYSQCLPCDERFISIQVSPLSETCGFFIEGYQQRIAIDATMGKVDVPQPAKIFYVTCGLES